MYLWRNDNLSESQGVHLGIEGLEEFFDEFGIR